MDIYDLYLKCYYNKLDSFLVRKKNSILGNIEKVSRYIINYNRKTLLNLLTKKLKIYKYEVEIPYTHNIVGSYIRDSSGPDYTTEELDFLKSEILISCVRHMDEDYPIHTRIECVSPNIIKNYDFLLYEKIYSHLKGSNHSDDRYVFCFKTKEEASKFKMLYVK